MDYYMVHIQRSSFYCLLYVNWNVGILLEHIEKQISKSSRLIPFFSPSFVTFYASKPSFNVFLQIHMSSSWPVYPLTASFLYFPVQNVFIIDHIHIQEV